MKIFIFIAVLLLSGCGLIPGYDMYKRLAIEEAKNTNNELLENCARCACDAVSHGAVKRRFPTDEKMAEFNRVCKTIEQ